MAVFENILDQETFTNLYIWQIRQADSLVIPHFKQIQRTNGTRLTKTKMTILKDHDRSMVCCLGSVGFIKEADGFLPPKKVALLSTKNWLV